MKVTTILLALNGGAMVLVLTKFYLVLRKNVLFILLFLNDNIRIYMFLSFINLYGKILRAKIHVGGEDEEKNTYINISNNINFSNGRIICINIF